MIVVQSARKVFTGVKGFDTLRARAYHVFICKKLESSDLTAQELGKLFPEGRVSVHGWGQIIQFGGYLQGKVEIPGIASNTFVVEVKGRRFSFSIPKA